MAKTSRARYTLEFKQAALRLVEGGQTIAAVAKTPGVVDQTLFNWAKAQSQGKHKGADNNPVSAEQMERHPCQGQAPLQGHHRQQPHVGDFAQLAQPRVQRNRA